MLSPDDPPAPGLPELAPDFVEEDAALIDEVVPTRGYGMLPIVGLGGSAGSIPALREFFEAMPPDSGMAFVVILHLSPEHQSTMADLLQRTTAMRVVEAQDSAHVEKNCVYVIPPGKHLSSVDGHLRLTELAQPHGKRVAVDLFFRSLADSHGPHSAAVVLSGADGDGAIGIKRIKERGGLTIAQDPDEAEHSSMPRSAIATGMVDWVLKVAQMPPRLLQYRAMEAQLQLPPEEGPQPAKVLPPAPDETEAALREVLVFLRSRTGRDFSYYKRATIVRRISRRMQVNGVASVPEYLDFLRLHPGESGALLQDLLISVTNFFRDRDSFSVLEEAIPRLIKGKKVGDCVRVWVPACATGEEAYSIAILLCEQAVRLDAPPAIQVFATDLDEGVIQAARDGVFPTTIAADVSEERLRRYFTRVPLGYRVRREIREVVLFAVHDLLKDSPFSRLDLISCRNLLIYLNREAQARALNVFHVALQRDGLLFLGSSESIEDGSALFGIVDKKHRLFARKHGARTILPVPEGPSSLAIASQSRARTGTVLMPRRFAPSAASALVAATAPHFPPSEPPGLSWAELHFRLIEHFAPPSVIVNEDHEIVHLSENAGAFLRFTGGEPSVNLLRVVHPMLRVELRALLARAAQTGEPAEAFRVELEQDGQRSAVDLRVGPASDLAPGYLLVVFDARPHAPGEEPVPRPPAEPIVEHLEREVVQVKAHLRDTVEQYEASTEELKASNEELQAMNEELRSATEELETSREELQSINEELTTVNAELKSKVDELGHANSDLHNLMASTAIATVFLDRALKVMRYTPSAVALFRLIPSDLGRPISDLQHRLEYPDFLADAEQVLETLVPVEREVCDAARRWFLARALPYRTLEDRIAGVVLTFVDITATKRAEQAMLAAKEELNVELTQMSRLHELSTRLLQSTELQPLLEQVLDAVMELQGADFGSVQLLESGTPNLRLVAQRGLAEEFLKHFHQSTILTSVCGRALSQKRRVIIEDVETDPEYAPHRAAAAAAGYRGVHCTPLFSRGGEPLGVLSCHFRQAHRPSDREGRFTDLYGRVAAEMIERQRSSQALRDAGERLLKAMNVAKMFSWEVDSRTGAVTRSPNVREVLGFDLPEHRPEWLRAGVYPEDRERVIASMDHAQASGAPYDEIYRLVHPQTGAAVWVHSQGLLIPGDPPRFVGLAQNITARKCAEEALRASEERYRALFESIDEAFVVKEVVSDVPGQEDFRYVECNPAFSRRTGLSNVIGRTVREVLPEIEPIWIQTYLQVIRTGEPVRFQSHLASLDRWLDVFVSRADGPESGRVAVIFSDITELMETQAALSSSREQLRLVIENAREYAIVALDLDRRVTNWNSGAQRLLGFSEAEILGQPGDLIFTPEDRAAAVPESEAATAIVEGRASDERWHLRKDGSRFWGSGAMMAMHDREEKVVGLVKIFRDQTEERTAREALEKSRADLWDALQANERARAEVEAASHAKDHFMAVLSHELRTPLTPVLMAVHTLLRRKDLPASVPEALEMIDRNIKIEARFIDDLLHFTRIDRGKLELARAGMDVHEALRQAVEVTASDLADKTQPLTVQLDAARHTIHGDFTRLQQVFWNLLKNASKFTPEGGAIRVASRNEPGRIVVEIIDRGIGLAPEDIARIFEPFTQASEQVTREFGGLGLGLAIARDTVEGHGGVIRAESGGVGQGTTLIVELPLEEP